jgi:hypothetical protein
VGGWMAGVRGEGRESEGNWSTTPFPLTSPPPPAPPKTLKATNSRVQVHVVLRVELLLVLVLHQALQLGDAALLLFFVFVFFCGWAGWRETGRPGVNGQARGPRRERKKPMPDSKNPGSTRPGPRHGPRPHTQARWSQLRAHGRSGRGGRAGARRPFSVFSSDEREKGRRAARPLAHHPAPATRHTRPSCRAGGVRGAPGTRGHGCGVARVHRGSPGLSHLSLPAAGRWGARARNAKNQFPRPSLPRRPHPAFAPPCSPTPAPGRWGGGRPPWCPPGWWLPPRESCQRCGHGAVRRRRRRSRPCPASLAPLSTPAWRWPCVWAPWWPAGVGRQGGVGWPRA